MQSWQSDWNGKPEDWGKGHYRDIPLSKWVKLCRERQKKDLERWLSEDPSFPYYFDEEEADQAVWFFQQLRHFDGEWAGQPFLLSDWQEWDIIRPLFGWKRNETGYRRFRYFFIYVSRKNGKSPLVGGIANYLLAGDGEPGAQVYSSATKEDQARIVWDYARKMTEAGSPLGSEIRSNKKAIWNEYLGSKFIPLGRDTKTQDGFSVHGGLIDEYHAHKDTSARDVLESGIGARRNPLIGIATTAGYGGPESPCEKERKKAEKILSGVLENEPYFAFLSTVDDPEKWKEPEQWYKANPNLGISVYFENFKDMFQQALQDPDKQKEFKTKNLNIPQKDSANPFIAEKQWNKCKTSPLPAELKLARAWGGLDLGITEDLSAFLLAFRLAGKKPGDPYRVGLLCRAFCPEARIYQKMESDGVNYPLWAEQGWIIPTPGETTRTDFIRREINDLAKLYDITEIRADRSHASELMQHLADDGFTVLAHSQGRWAMNEPIKVTKELILQQRIEHAENPLLTWTVLNAVIDKDAQERMMFRKDKATDRIDPAVAMVMAVGGLVIAPDYVQDMEVVAL